MRRQLAPIALILALLPGCGGSGHYVWVTGKLLKGGSPYKPPEGQSVTLAFVGIETQDASGRMVKYTDQYQANLDESGSFQVLGPEGQGIPPGKYRVAISQRYTREAFETLKNKPKTLIRDDDLLKDEFGPMKSPIVREIKGRADLVIDMDKPTEGAPAGG
jgi:hypothetical protein